MFSNVDLPGLLALVARGDRSALRALYEHTQDQLFPVARYLMHSETAAVELLQATYMAIWHRADGFDAARVPAMTWITALLRRLAFERLAIEPAAPGPAWDAAELEALWRPKPAALGAWAGELRRRQRLLHCAGRLELAQRQALSLAFLRNWGPFEVARELGLAPAEARATLRRALAHLKDCLGSLR
ncbi:hypothetical protein OOT46_15645 [Aquabacterium sp. A7-Y]|uniref:sigma factor n=1 Tax=Aquabacterium sp. A7-Y TaxID=1349605 RepID=UPI00223D4B23|nr:sigma factor [Aquabacterium sp. A7-Y]MCW7539277.1 hypothetical protein [Aquabacterium sp. A7-Y]